MGTRENDGAVGACDEEGHEALRGGTNDTDLPVELDEVPLRGPEDPRPGPAADPRAEIAPLSSARNA
jgi:hypothetical protein